MPELKSISVIRINNVVPAGIVVCNELSPVAFATVIDVIVDVTGK